MHIGATPTYPSPAPSLPARPIAPAASADVSPDLTRAAQAPATPSPALSDEQRASAREEADQPAEQSTPSADKQDKSEPSPQQQRLEQLEIAELATRDREVRSHEQAHAAVGGGYAGAPSFTYTRGPDGQRYAVAGEVSIDTGAVAGDPQATLSKMEIVVRAALSPAEPSAQDLRVAAQAQAQMVQARVDLAELQRNEAAEAQAERAQSSEAAEPAERDGDPAASPQPSRSSAAELELYRRTAGLPDSAPLIDLLG
ncbi:putative metalloprotease CJM1_0395 family protein [Pseudomonas sp. SA3-5]|uniref:Metalloprotease CJM1_0395 family protein n=1 Tax=Pseudomonas aestuarii TaxID=3018340 RepID=A0ABT4XLF0_9PSED|nr:putative metalloprotease CJM1_0395 family protein [Pseudomonas aestuarii]MDA7089028.1 putative metalloprotease CJM1_0395 family protein [Pseudomonas aestuarii]